MKHAGLKKEIDATLMFFIKTDINIYGKITESTKEAFKKQGVKIPEQHKRYLWQSPALYPQRPSEAIRGVFCFILEPK